MLKGFFTSFSRLLLPTSSVADIGKLIFLATCIASFLLFTTNSFFEYDSTLFVMYAEALLHGTEHLTNSDVVRYDIAYPLLLILSGYPYHHSLIGITLINTIMGISMPVLIYLTIKPVFPKGAYYIALTTILSLSPFYYIKWFRPDHAYMFFAALCIYLLSLFVHTKRPVFLYSLTCAVITASLFRAAGNILFPFFIVMAFLFVRGSLKKYMICMVFGLCVLFLYSFHRHHFFSHFGNQSSFNGGQTFQNLYLNSQEFGIYLSPDLGPAMKEITDNLYRAILPRPSLSSMASLVRNAEENFYKQHVYPFNAQEFMHRIYETPSWDYNDILYAASLKNDPLFMKASWEIIRHYPWYPFAYIARNMWHLLYNPGFAHTQFNVNPYSRMSIDDAFPYDAPGGTSVILTPRAINELIFDNFSHKFYFVQWIINCIKHIFCSSYLKITHIIFYFMAITWIAASLDIVNRLLPSKKLQSLVDLLPKKTTPLVIILSLYLFLSMLIISVFVDPMLRFHNHLIPCKIMLAGLGAGIMFHVIYRAKSPYFSTAEQNNLPTHQSPLQLKKHKIVALRLILMMVVFLASWSGYIVSHTS